MRPNTVAAVAAERTQDRFIRSSFRTGHALNVAIEPGLLRQRHDRPGLSRRR